MKALKEDASGLQIGPTPGRKVSFHGAAPSAQRAGAAQAEVALAAGATPTKAEFDALVALTHELRAALVEKGLIKGAA